MHSFWTVSEDYANQEQGYRFFSDQYILQTE